MAKRMKKLGLIGGATWVSTIEYYRHLNQIVNFKLGDHHSARLTVENLQFQEISDALNANRWDLIERSVCEAGRALKRSQVGAILLCSNTLHGVFNELSTEVAPVPVLHLGDALADEIQRQRYKHVGLLGTRPTMEFPFYKDYIAERSGAKIVTPEEPRMRTLLHEAIFNRMAKDNYIKSDANLLDSLVYDMRKDGADAVILGCTELPKALRVSHLPLLDSTRIHCNHAARWALS